MFNSKSPDGRLTLVVGFFWSSPPELLGQQTLHKHAISPMCSNWCLALHIFCMIWCYLSHVCSLLSFSFVALVVHFVAWKHAVKSKDWILCWSFLNFWSLKITGLHRFPSSGSLLSADAASYHTNRRFLLNTGHFPLNLVKHSCLHIKTVRHWTAGSNNIFLSFTHWLKDVLRTTCNWKTM